MKSKTLTTVITAVILVILGVAILKFAVRVLLPVAIIVIAAYIVYMLVTGKKLR